MEESSIDLCSNIARIYSSHSEENKRHGGTLLLEAPESVRFESRVSVATLEIPERRKANLQEPGVSEGERFESDKIQAYKEEGSFSRDSVILMCLPLV